jgi:membrane-associated phospholipid phosphatase
MPTWARTSLQVTTTTTAAAVGWARVESRKHFPTDVLAGACLGNFLSVFIHDAFMNLPEDSRFGFHIEPSPKGVWAAVSWDF